MNQSPKGILLVNKPAGITSFQIVRLLRRKLGVKKIGHAGTLDPFATGLMVMLIGREYTRLSDTFLNSDKEYLATIKLGEATDTHDNEGTVTYQSSYQPDLPEVEKAIALFQGQIEQIPPMFSAKKVAGKKLYQLARQGQEVERKPITVVLNTTLISYQYPDLKIRVSCSKGTYIRSIADELGKKLHCGGHLTELCRIRSGKYFLSDSIDIETITSPETDLAPFLQQNI
ncbi:MAG: tRNA pseudouridine(55) synthase TruB [Chlamydiota bacterium]